MSESACKRSLSKGVQVNALPPLQYSCGATAVQLCGAVVGQLCSSAMSAAVVQYPCDPAAVYICQQQEPKLLHELL